MKISSVNDKGGVCRPYIEEFFLAEVHAGTGHPGFLLAPANPMYIGLASDFSFLAGELRSAGTAADFLGKAVGGIEERGSAFHLCLDLCVGVAVDDCLMAVSHVILWQFAAVRNLVLFDWIGHIAFLPSDVPGVDLVENKLPHRGFLKIVTEDGADACVVQVICNVPQGNAVDVHLKHPSDRFGFFGNDDVLFLLLIVLVAEDVLVGHANLAALEPLVDTPFHILGNAAAFFLRERSEERKFH